MAYPFVQARHYQKTTGRDVDLIVIHDMEAPEGALTAESIANYFAVGTRVASAHYNVDINSIVQSVRDQDVAYHAPGASHNGLGIEHAGYARQSAAEWGDDYSTRMLRDVSAPLVATLCKRHNIPIKFVDAAGLRRGERGITTHWEVSKAFGKSSHWDPGPHFPMQQYLDWIRFWAGEWTFPPQFEIKEFTMFYCGPKGVGGIYLVNLGPCCFHIAHPDDIPQLRKAIASFNSDHPHTAELHPDTFAAIQAATSKS